MKKIQIMISAEKKVEEQLRNAATLLGKLEGQKEEFECVSNFKYYRELSDMQSILDKRLAYLDKKKKEYKVVDKKQNMYMELCADSIFIMTKADICYFPKDWANYRDLVILWFAAKGYGKEIRYFQ